MNPIRRRLTIAPLAATLGAAVPFAAYAQKESFPSRPITLVVPSGPGTGADTLGRIAAQNLGDAIGQSVVVENVVGASGIIGVQKVARSRPDGYTLLFGFNQVATINPSVMTKLSYDVDKDLVPVSRFAESSFIWIVNQAVPVKTLPELILYAKANPGKLAVGVTGSGSATNLGLQLLSQLTGAEFLAVNYSNTMSADFLSNVIQLIMSPAATAGIYLQGGKGRALAQTGASRSQSFPDLPTVAEFYPGYFIPAWYGIWAPAGTPRPIVDRLTTELIKVVALPDVAARLASLAAEPVGSSAEDLRNVTKRETVMWQNLVKARNISLVQ